MIKYILAEFTLIGLHPIRWTITIVMKPLEVVHDKESS